MGWFDGFPFKSKEQMEKERKDFEKRVFPLGEPEREAILQLLRELAPGNKKSQDNDRLYAFISAKDKLTGSDTREEGLRRAKYELEKQSWLGDEPRQMILALVQLEAEIESLADLPTIEQVRATAKATSID